ncbi:FAD-dependent monooxygenase [Mucilaginibacter sp.]|uniref:FAD-dependent monooxygenase n=1 Tax=Mucilaginibacter sp. TaxID=1882438 RepID=UPI0035BC4BA7
MKNILISGASIAGLATAWWMDHLGYKVTVVELAAAPRTAGAAVDIRDDTTAIVKRMGLYHALRSKTLQVQLMEFKNADDVTEASIVVPESHEDIEIERPEFMEIMLADLKNRVDFIFNDRITAFVETDTDITVTFKNAPQQSFHLVLGCDGMHSGVRKLWFGEEAEYAHFLEAYFSITIVNKLLIPTSTMQGYNSPGKAVMLNAYNGKTDIIFCFVAEEEIPYHYRDVEQQRQLILKNFTGGGWRTDELLAEIEKADNFYFDKFCQIKMQSWSKGRIALVGDAAYCASPAAGMGASLSIAGAAALADALVKHNGNFENAFKEYNNSLRPFIEEVQATALNNVRKTFLPRTEEEIHQRNTHMTGF